MSKLNPAPSLSERMGRRLVVWVPLAWLGVFFLAPFFLVLKISLARARMASPPYTDLVDWSGGGWPRLDLAFDNFLYVLGESLYASAYLRSLRVALISTAACLLLGYPMAYAIARARPHWRRLLLLLVILPFWTSFLVRVYSWKVLLQGNGFLNSSLLALGVIEEPLAILYTDFAVYLGIVYSYLPFMILPLYAVLERLDVTLDEAAADLGATRRRTFFEITVPQSLPGILAGCMLVFLPAVGEFVIPELLGGPDSVMIGRTLWNDFFANRDWPLASAVAIIMLALLLVPILYFQRTTGAEIETIPTGEQP